MCGSLINTVLQEVILKTIIYIMYTHTKGASKRKLIWDYSQNKFGILSKMLSSFEVLHRIYQIKPLR